MSGLPEAVHRLELDVLEDASVSAAVETVVREQGRIDVLVNNAGISRVGARI